MKEIERPVFAKQKVNLTGKKYKKSNKKSKKKGDFILLFLLFYYKN